MREIQTNYWKACFKRETMWLFIGMDPELRDFVIKRCVPRGGFAMHPLKHIPK
jgi:hypothetical protein